MTLSQAGKWGINPIKEILAGTKLIDNMILG